MPTRLYTHMLTEQNTNPEWKRINMRNVEHALGVEFLHDLYNQHVSRINSIRFRNTVTIWKNGVANSYAPSSEFHSLEKFFGDRLFALDKRVISEIQTLLRGDRSYLKKFFSSREKLQLTALSNADLFYFLCDIQYQSLGELYKLNFVQIEYSLTAAIKRELAALGVKNEDEVFSKIISCPQLTESQLEEIAFLRILQSKKSKSIPLTQQIKARILKHYAMYAFMHCAYGEPPYTIEYYLKKWMEYDPEEPASARIKAIVTSVKRAGKEGKKILKKINSKRLNILVPLMILGGTFRDKNKSFLGRTIRFKFEMFDEIARRKLDERGNLNYYLLSDFGALLTEGTQLDRSLLEMRKVDGIVLQRSEYATSGSDEGIEAKVRVPVDITSRKGALIGRCACPGKVRGRARIVINNKDSHKVTFGDIMVAIGTDFDLMDAIHRSVGVITEEGGLLSHASVVCREMNKPCLIGVPEATTRIKDNDMVELDSTNNTVRIIYE